MALTTFVNVTILMPLHFKALNAICTKRWSFPEWSVMSVYYKFCKGS